MFAVTAGNSTVAGSIFLRGSNGEGQIHPDRKRHAEREDHSETLGKFTAEDEIIRSLLSTLDILESFFIFCESVLLYYQN